MLALKVLKSPSWGKLRRQARSVVRQDCVRVADNPGVARYRGALVRMSARPFLCPPGLFLDLNITSHPPHYFGKADDRC
jgi:hypothetical protein